MCLQGVVLRKEDGPTFCILIATLMRTDERSLGASQLTVFPASLNPLMLSVTNFGVLELHLLVS